MKVLFIIPTHAINSPIMMHTFMVTLCFHIEFHRKATVINCCELKKLKVLKKRLLLYMCCNVISYYNVISYELIFRNEVHLARFGPVWWKSSQINVCSSHVFSLDLSYKQSVLGSVQCSQGTNGTWRVYVARGAAPASGGWRAVRVGGKAP